MDFGIVTIFPGMFDSFLSHGIVRRAVEAAVIRVVAIDIRDFAKDKRRTVDDKPYGGGSGMVMKPEPLSAAIQASKAKIPGAPVALLSPQGRRFTQRVAQEYAALKGVIFICGRYEGVDERIYQSIDDEVSIGDYVLTGGEPAAMVIIDAVTRLLPGALGAEDSADRDSFSGHLLEHAHYTRPPVFEGESVPDVLLSGHHGRVAQWRRETSLVRTLLKRPDLLDQRELEESEKEILKKWCRWIEQAISS
jgi:tRNA (guanine37-N1)-methyltransferase